MFMLMVVEFLFFFLVLGEEVWLLFREEVELVEGKIFLIVGIVGCVFVMLV